MLEKAFVIDRIEILEYGQIQVRRTDKIIENSSEIAKAYHRHVLAPGDNIEGEDAKVVAIATTVWTPEVIAAYKASIAK